MSLELQRLKRDLQLADAIWLGLGSILGTGIFVSIGIAAGVSGPAVIVAIALAAFVATFNALSSAQLAAAHPVSGGTYEYGYKFLGPAWGFMAGWVFLLAKSASAATAALGFAGYSLSALGITSLSPVIPAFITVLLLTAIVMLGARRTSRVNTVVVTITLLSLATFVVSAAYYWMSGVNGDNFSNFFRGDTITQSALNLFEATALMFVAYTGYGRIATLAEEVEEPQKVIPKAIVATLLVSGITYLAVAVSAIGTVGAEFLSDATRGNAAPLSLAARTYGIPFIPELIATGAATAMLSVLMNLVLGLSRVGLAMGRRGDLPQVLGRLDKDQRTPVYSVLAVGLAIAALTFTGSVKTTWSFSALTVLSYYAITNAAALAVPADARIFPRWISYAGLISCLFLTFFIDRYVWIYGGILVAAGAAWFLVARKIGAAGQRRK